MNVHDIVVRLRSIIWIGSDALCREAADEIERLRKERDEARREACERTAENLSLLGSNVLLSTLRVEHAARRGWYCFKEDNHNA